MARKSEAKLEDEQKDTIENNGENIEEGSEQKTEVEAINKEEVKSDSEGEKKGGEMTRIYVKNPRLKFLSKSTENYVNFIPGILKSDGKESYVGYYDTNDKKLVDEIKQTSYFLQAIEIK